MSEEEIMEIIQESMRKYAEKFAFGYYGASDIAQEIFLLCREAIPKYDKKRPLRAFLNRHVRNRLINLKRNKYRRYDPPCRKCYSGNPCGADGGMCMPYLEWARRNFSKASIMSPVEYIETDSGKIDSTIEDVIERETIQNLLAAMPEEMRTAVQKHIAGEKVSKRLIDEAYEFSRKFIYEEEA